jgi:hypothetical protein
MSVYQDNRKRFIDLLNSFSKAVITKAELRELCDANNLNIPQWFINDDANKIARGVFKIPGKTLTEEELTTVKASIQNDEVEHFSGIQTKKPGLHIQTLVTTMEEQVIIPDRYKNYVPFGAFDDIKSIVHSRKFYPVFITGPSGNGKSMSVEQVCAHLGREYICYSMTPESDETDLLGGYVLINNEMVWRDGPVTIAARRGAVLCVDEIDYGAQNLSVLQRVLEGKPFLLKKKGEIVHPKEGFQIFATANTKGRGSDDGRYMFTNVLNEAFLERFPITFEQEWAPATVEKRIIKKELEYAGKGDDEFANHLVMWAGITRKLFEDDGISDVISTRRLVHIAKAYPIFNDRIKSINYCLNRFDNDTKRAMIDMYTKVDASVTINNSIDTQAAPPAQPVNPEAATT